MAPCVLITSELETYIASLQSYLNRESDDENRRGGTIAHGPEPNAKPGHMNAETTKNLAHRESNPRRKDHKTTQCSKRDDKEAQSTAGSRNRSKLVA